MKHGRRGRRDKIGPEKWQAEFNAGRKAAQTGAQKMLPTRAYLLGYTRGMKDQHDRQRRPLTMTTHVPTSFSSLKKRLKKGVKLELVAHSRFPDLPATIAGVREIVKAQSNAIALADYGINSPVWSWLYWPKADKVRETENGFEVAMPEDDGSFTQTMRYEYR